MCVSPSTYHVTHDESASCEMNTEMYSVWRSRQVARLRQDQSKRHAVFYVLIHIAIMVIVVFKRSGNRIIESDTIA